MSGILAIDTATEACSVALYRDGNVQEIHEITPRQQSYRLFSMLRELLPSGQLADHGIDAIAYGSGPGSFTGLRIAASAVQGLAFANGLPGISISTLAAQAQAVLREGGATEGDTVLSTLDARIGEIYHAAYRFENGLAVEMYSPVASAASAIELQLPASPLYAIGSGCRFFDEFPDELKGRVLSVNAKLVSRAKDLIPLALAKLSAGDVQNPRDVHPVYVRDEINWKKIPQQGKQA